MLKPKTIRWSEHIQVYLPSHSLFPLDELILTHFAKAAKFRRAFENQQRTRRIMCSIRANLNNTEVSQREQPVNNRPHWFTVQSVLHGVGFHVEG